MTPSPEQRFTVRHTPGRVRRPIESFFEKTDGCWLWTGARMKRKGFISGVYRVPDGRLRSAYAVVYEALVGPIPPGLEPDHLCKNTLCVRPDHLEPVTHKENLMRGNSPSARNAKKTLAPCGHPYDGHDGRRRYCKSCRVIWQREYYRRTQKGIIE